LPLPLRKRNMPRLPTGLVCVRERFDCVEIPLNSIMKSMNSRSIPGLFSFGLEMERFCSSVFLFI